jgi:CheY-like chemotaxis protein
MGGGMKCPRCQQENPSEAKFCLDCGAPVAVVAVPGGSYAPALVLMDIQLPGISGIVAFQQLRADPSTCRIPIIAITASVMAQDRQKIMAAGFDGFQGKPISVRELLETIRTVLDKSGQ